MKRTRKKIETIMRDDGDNSFFSIHFFFYLLSLLYKLITKGIDFLYEKKIFIQKRLPCFVISIGNITAGGTGKTPMTIYLAKLLKKNGFSPAVISRGYKGKFEKKGGIVSDGKNILAKAEYAGDESFMMAERLKGIPIIAGQNRYISGMTAIKKFGSDVIILDDGFQHRKLFRDLDLLLLDSEKPFGNNHTIPRGVLREPPSSTKRADALILTRCRYYTQTKISEKPLFKSRHMPYICEKDFARTEKQDILKEKKIIAISAIAKNRDFHNTIENMGGNLEGFLAFDDHHKYSEKDFLKLSELAEKTKPDIIATTEKDFAKFPSDLVLPAKLVIIGVSIAFEKNDEIAFENFIKEKIKKWNRSI